MFTGLSDNMPSPGGQPVRLYHTLELNSPSKRMADIYVLGLFGCSWAITLLINPRLSLPPASVLAGSLLGSPLMLCYKCCGGQGGVLLLLKPPDMRVRSQSALGAAVNGQMHRYLCESEQTGRWHISSVPRSSAAAFPFSRGLLMLHV